MSLFDHFLRLPEKIRFLFVGGINTAMGYGVFTGLYLAFGDRQNYLLVLVFSFLISASFAFLNLKYFVFLSKGRIKQQYIRTLISYGITLGLSLFFLWVFVDGFKMPILLSQALNILIIAIITYLIHKYFSFR